MTRSRDPRCRRRQRRRHHATQVRAAPGRRDDDVDIGAVAIGLTALAAYLVLPMFLGTDLWRAYAEDWPGGGYAFSTCAGALFICSAAGAVGSVVLAVRAGRRRGWWRVLAAAYWAAAGVCITANVCCWSVAVITVGGRGGRHRACPDNPDGLGCWAQSHYPGGFLTAVIGGAVVFGTAVSLSKARDAWASRRREARASRRWSAWVSHRRDAAAGQPPDPAAAPVDTPTATSAPMPTAGPLPEARS
jgi:hypothetical protein